LEKDGYAVKYREGGPVTGAGERARPKGRENDCHKEGGGEEDLLVRWEDKKRLKKEGTSIGEDSPGK